MADDPPKELIAAIAAGRALIVCGAGVSRAATGGAAPGWAKLIEDGLECASRLCAADDQVWAEACRIQLKSKKTADWLRAADAIQEKLGGPSGGDYRAFFSKNLSTLENTKPELLQALAKLAGANNPIATTNYDHLISRALKWERIDWVNYLGVVEALRGKRQAVWHIHGDYDRPESIIFSRADYQRIVQHEFSQFVQQLAALNFTFVFVGCSGSGLGDDNVGELLNWLRKGFAGLGDQHYVLVADSNTDKWPAGVHPVKFGDHGDLPAYLDRLAPAAPAVASFPVDPKMIGREDRLAELVDAILNRQEPILVPGALGMGKTTLAVAACYDPAVIARFGAGLRFFVNLEPVPDAEGVLRALANALRLDPSGAVAALETAIAEDCAAKPALVILDNLETPWRSEKAKTEALLERLAAMPGLRLIVTVRGAVPFIHGGSYPLRDIEQLSPDEARELFLRYAGPHHASDPALPDLLAALDGHPLSIELLAANAAGKANLRNLATDWNTRSAAMMLRRGSADHRLNSLRASLEISFAALGESSAAHRLLRLIALLPAGMAAMDCAQALSDGAPNDEEEAAASTLETARLASRRDDRSRLLAPVREVLLEDFPPEPKDKARLMALFLSRAALGQQIGTAGWDDARDGVTAEAGNFDAMIGDALNEIILPNGLVAAVAGLAEFHSFTGLASVASLSGAIASLRKAGDVLGEANCISSLGDIALGRSDHDAARVRFEEALPLYRKVGDVLGEANCIQSLGEIALRRSDHAGARARFEEALALYRKVGNLLGEANCVASLGDIALRQSDHDAAHDKYEAALPLYRKVGDVLGEANCIRSLGDIARRRSDHATARTRYEEALPLYRKVGAMLGEANCIASLGDVALAQSDHVAARARYEEALPLFRNIGTVAGEANCIGSLGDIDLAEQDLASARRRWSEALDLYGRIPEPYSIGLTHIRLARHAPTPAQAAAHREAARQAWASIDRADLIAEYLDKKR